MNDNEDLTKGEREVADMLRAAGGERIDWVAPPDGMWSRIEIELSRGRAAGPRLVAVESVSDSSAAAPSPRRLSRRTLLAALGGGIAAGIALGALGRGVLDSGVLGSGGGRALRTAELRTLTTAELLGEAILRERGDALFLEILASEPIEFAAGIVEVWLINVDGQRMVSLGVYQGDAAARFPVPPLLLEQGFILVDLSREPLDGDNNHSGDSIVRGELH